MQRDYTQINKDIDMILAKVDKQGEWTTNRMMSIAKEMPRDWIYVKYELKPPGSPGGFLL